MTDTSILATTGGSFMFPLYQRINGSVYLVCGGTLVTLGGPADITYYNSLGSKTILESSLTVNGRSHMNALPVV